MKIEIVLSPSFGCYDIQGGKTLNGDLKSIADKLIYFIWYSNYKIWEMFL